MISGTWVFEAWPAPIAARGGVVIDLEAHQSALEGSYLLVLTSNTREKAAVNSLMASSKSVLLPCEHKGASIGMLAGRLALHVTGECGVSNQQSLARIANTLLGGNFLPLPSIVLLVGFCWGRPGKTSIGSLVVAREVASVNYRILRPGGESLRVRRYGSSIEISEECERKLRQSIPDVVFGPILSSEALLQSDAAREEVLECVPDAVAGEMEAFGFISANFPWLVVKAVSDAGGDLCNRDDQDSAALIAARSIAPLIECLEQVSEVAAHIPTEASELLRVVLIGDVLSLDAREVLGPSLGAYLNNDIGVWLAARLREFGAPQSVQNAVLSAVLEISQNALERGRAGQVSVKVTGEGIEVYDNGMEFDFFTLRDGRGGAYSSNTIRLLAGAEPQNLSIRYGWESGVNCHVFVFPGRSIELVDARRNCSISFDFAKLRQYFSGEGHAFKVPSGCQVLYLDASPLRMSSLQHDLARAVELLLADYRKVYLSCRNEDDASFFRGKLAHLLGDRVIVFVE